MNLGLTPTTYNNESELDAGDNSDEEKQEDYNFMDVYGSGEDQLDDSDEDHGDIEF